jgi:hypothetical protein
MDLCSSARDGECDDGGANSEYDDCAGGTDCTDCGIRITQPSGAFCDGSSRTICSPMGGQHFQSGNLSDGVCSCPDCPWDATDCLVIGSACDGAAISTCCASDNPCGFAGDGYCDCGGWCDWETVDCTTPSG